MPTYTYRCENCSYHFDLYLRFEDPDPSQCPNCGTANQIQRVYKPVGVVFKGSGFYATDNKSRATLAPDGTKPEAEAGGDSKSGDTKSSPADSSAKSDSGNGSTSSSSSGSEPASSKSADT